MSQALPGSHYCKMHQGNHAHYDPINCDVCKLQQLLCEARTHLHLHEEEYQHRAPSDLLQRIDEVIK